MLSLYLPALIVAFLITTLELTEVAALVFALSAGSDTIRPGALGAVGGTGVIAIVALGFGAVLLAFPHADLLWASAVLLAAFGVFLFRSTLRAYRRERAAAEGHPVSFPSRPPLQFVGGFTVGAVESTEAVIVLLALAAAGYGLSALVGAVIAGAVLVIAAALVHERIRRIKVPWLKLGATSLLFAFAVFWAGEAAGLAWPGADLSLIPLFLVFLLADRGAIALALGGRPSGQPSS
jgi:Ca2+/H+ antiporter, TMEM165/GDT1 family